jgi:flagellar biogenesis protein FliO
LLIEQVLAAFFVLALLVATLWFLRQKGIARLNYSISKPFSGLRQMKVVDRVVLTPQHSLYLVQLRDRQIVVGVSPSGCNRVAAFRDAPSGEMRELANEVH